MRGLILVLVMIVSLAGVVFMKVGPDMRALSGMMSGTSHQLQSGLVPVSAKRGDGVADDCCGTKENRCPVTGAVPTAPYYKGMNETSCDGGCGS